MRRPGECDFYWKILKEKITEQCENINLNNLENCFNKAIAAAIEYGKQEVLKKTKDPLNAWA